jgi:hypothetical protein
MKARILPCLAGVVVGSVLTCTLPALAQFVRDFARVERDPVVAELDSMASDAELVARSLVTRDASVPAHVRRVASTLGPRLRTLAQVLRDAPTGGPVRPMVSADESWRRSSDRTRHGSDAHGHQHASHARCDHAEHGRHGHSCPGAPMSQGDFAKLLAAFDGTMLSHRREALLDAAMRESYFYTEQVGMLMEHCTFDRDRLALAIKLAPRLVDRARAYTLAEKLTFLHSRDELYRELSIARHPERGPY